MSEPIDAADIIRDVLESVTEDAAREAADLKRATAAVMVPEVDATAAHVAILIGQVRRQEKALGDAFARIAALERHIP